MSTENEDLKALAEVIWTASRADESTISAIGADHVAMAVLGSDVLADIKRAAKIAALREAAAEWAQEYESLTLQFGAYGQTKIRAAYRLGSILLGRQADQMEEPPADEPKVVETWYV